MSFIARSINSNRFLEILYTTIFLKKNMHALLIAPPCYMENCDAKLLAII